MTKKTKASPKVEYKNKGCINLLLRITLLVSMMETRIRREKGKRKNNNMIITNTYNATF